MLKFHAHFLSLVSSLGSVFVLSQGAIAQEIYTFEPLPTTAPEIPLWEDVPAMEPVFYDPVIPETSPGQEYIFEAPAP
ncbi:MAG: hypothetical protein VKJ86_12635, partial [Synechococcus sp.]|nr:hypothetical protein [Synechococcus sp.]